MKSLCVLFICTLCIFNELQGQEQRFNYEHFNAESGLIYDEILYAHLDVDGFIWLATATGLQCKESYSFKEYYFDPNDSSSISDNFITTIFEDKSGNIWIGTGRDGLNMFDKEYANFYTYKYNAEDSNSISSDIIPRARKVITQDIDGYLWVNTDKSLNKIDISNRTVERLYGNYKGQLIYDKDEHALWIADNALKKFNIKTRKLDIYNFDTTTFNHFSYIHSIILDNEGLIWLGTDTGVAIFDKARNIFYSLEAYLYEKGVRNKLNYDWTGEQVHAVYQDFRNNIWLAIEKSIYILNKDDGKFTVLRHETENKNSLLDGSIAGIFGNRKGTVLVAYLRKGFSKLDINIKNFKHIQSNEDEPNSINSDAVRSIFKDKRNNLWIGTYDHGINFIPNQNKENIRFHRYNAHDINTINSNYVTTIYVDSEERLWVGTFEDGYCYADHIYDKTSLKFTRSALTENVEVHEFFQDQQGRIWIATNLGFYIYDKKNNKEVYYGEADNHANYLQELNIQSVIHEAPNIFWLATWNKGVCKLILNSDSLLAPTVSKDSLIVYTELDGADQIGLDNRFITFQRDQKNVFWLGSNVNGLVKMVETDVGLTFTKYDMTAGAPSNSVYGIEEDNVGNIWVSTTKGIGKFIPAQEQFLNYYESDGIQSNSFSWDSHFQSDDGELFFGGINGLTTFYPEDIVDEETFAKAYISRLIVNHNEVKTGQKVNNHIILDKEIRFTDMLTLSHRESVFSLEFSVIGNYNPKEVLYSYTLEGYDDKWINTAAEKRTVTYTNLDDGMYLFKVKASTQLGNWDELTTLQITILPPLWRTWWAFILYFVVFMLLLFLFQQQLVNRATLKHSLEMEHYKHARDNELNQEKFRFFTNLAHEYRTPLTLILGPLDKMIRNNDGNNRVHQKLLLIHKQALKLLKLTNHLMNFRKYETDNLKLKSAEGNVIDFINEISVAFRNQARSREIHFHYNSDKKEIKLWYDRDKLEIVFANLLSNAFKFTPPNGTVNLKVAQTTLDHIANVKKNCQKMKSACYGDLPISADRFLQIEMKDTGCGINSDQLAHIFERYFQASNLQSISIGGTGIGLEITKNYVELHHGSIMVNSEEGKGTTFYLWFPLGRKHLHPDDIISDFKSSEHIDHYQIDESSFETENIDELLNEVNSEDEMLKLLIIDDNHDIMVYLKSIFEKSYAIQTATNGKDGLNIAMEKNPDLIISDIMMPEIDGLELCKRIKSDVRTSHIPVILLTARTTNIFQTEGLEIGADDYITKPFNERVLSLKVKNLIASRAHLRNKYSKEITLKPKDITITSADEKFLNELIALIEAHLSESNFKVEDISKHMGMSHSVIYKKISSLTDLSLVEFIRTIRLKTASELLTKTNMTVGQASFEVGFADPKYFSKCFQKYFGKTPSEFITVNRNLSSSKHS